MAHVAQHEYIKGISDLFPKNFNNVKVLEIGSLNINGTARDFFNNAEYTGIDVGEGPGVDIVVPGQIYDAPEATYDTVISTECFEHNPYWEQTFVNMYRMCKTNGLILMTCATTGRSEHGTTRTTPQDSPLTIGKGWDYYRNLTERDFRNIFNIDSMFSVHQFTVNTSHCDLYFWGIKR